MPTAPTQSIPSVDAYIAAHPAPGTTGTNTYSYVNNTGSVQNVNAPSPQQAIANAPNRDVHSGVVNPPLTSEPSVVSTDNGRSVLKDAIAGHTADMQTLAGQTPAKTDTTASDSTNWAMKQVGGVTADEAKAANIDLSGYNYDADSGYFLPINGTPTQQQQFTQDKQKIDDSFSSQVLGMDAATQALMASISNIYNDRITAQQDANKRELQGFNTMNIRNGTSRYAGGVAQSILTADENAGLDRVKAIAHEMAGQLAQANDNLTAKKYTAFMDNRAAIDKLTTERATTLKGLQDKAVAAQTKINQQKIQASRDSAIGGLIEQGITEPAKILDYLNFDEKGNSTGDFTAKEVTDALKALSPTDDLKGLSASYQDFFTLKQKGLLPDSIANLPEGQQLFAFLKQEKAITAASRGKAGDGVYTPVNPKDVSSALQLLNDTTADANGYAVKGTDGYVDPNVYRQIYNNWLASGYDPKAFFKYFDTSRYINPTDNASLPSYLRTSAKDTPTSSIPGPKPTASVIGSARALKDKGASDEEIRTFISESGFNPDDSLFSDTLSGATSKPSTKKGFFPLF